MGRTIPAPETAPKRKSKRTKMPDDHPICMVCRHWRNDCVITVYEPRQPKATVKKCLVTGKTVKPYDVGCKELEISRIFYCLEKECFMYADACVHRHKTIETDDCVFCTIGIGVAAFLEKE